MVAGGGKLGFDRGHDAVLLAADDAQQGSFAVLVSQSHLTDGGPLPVVETERPLLSFSTCNESCMTFIAAFLILFALALLALPVVWVLGRRRLRS